MEQRFAQNFITPQIMLGPEVPPHSHFDLELLYVLSGQIGLEVEGAACHMEAEDIILINSKKKHSLHRLPNAKNPGLVCSLHISWSYLCGYTGNQRMRFWCNSMRDLENGNYEQLRGIMQKILIDYINSGGSGPHFYRQSLYFGLLHLLVNFFMLTDMGDGFAPAGPKDPPDHMEAMTEYLEQQYSQDISLTDLADYMGLSVSYISRYFKKKTGKNFVDHLYRIRLCHAMEELACSDKSITSIALDCGFPNIATFNKLFRKEYGATPSEYRRKERDPASEERERSIQREERAKNALRDYLNVSHRVERTESPETGTRVRVDISQYVPYEPIWNRAINLGPAEMILDSNIQQAILYSKRHLEFQYGRFWSIFSPNMYIMGDVRHGSGRFNRLDRILNFLIENGITPIIELGEKQNRIQRSITNYVRESDNTSLFGNYEEFLQTVEEMMRHLTAYYTEERVNNWVFELWDDHRVEVYHDKRPYMTVYTDVTRIIKKYAPSTQVGGAGNYLGWFRQHTEDSLRMWTDHGIYPDFLTFTYSPYALGDLPQERMSKRKSDEDDLLHSIEELNRLMLSYGFPKKRVFISEWNMTASSRNYFNDSLWKASYIIKCCIDNLGKVDTLTYSQLQDGTTDYYDTQQLLNGSGGLLTRDSIEKPAFMAMRLLRHLQKYLVAKGDDYIITRDEYGKITMVIHNFIKRNYLYYLKEEYENTPQEHYTYFEHQNKKTMHFELQHLLPDTEYDIHHHVVNRQNGSIMDEWAAFGFRESMQAGDIEYLRRISVPRLYTQVKRSEGDHLPLDVELEPLEIRCISLRPIRT